jgi:hypothetical protein
MAVSSAGVQARRPAASEYRRGAAGNTGGRQGSPDESGEKAASPEEDMNTSKLNRSDHWMKWARESWLTPFMAGTLGGFFMFWM